MGVMSSSLGPLDAFLHKVHRLLEFFIFLGEGCHPFDQLVALLGWFWNLTINNRTLGVQRLVNSGVVSGQGR